MDRTDTCMQSSHTATLVVNYGRPA